MLAFCLKELRVRSYYFGSDLQNFRRTSSSWNLILSSRKLHDASSTAPPVEKKLKLLDYASMRQEETIERRTQLCESESDRKTLISDALKSIDIRWYVANFKVDHIIRKMENLTGEILPASSMYEKLVLYYIATVDKVDVAIDLVDVMSEAGLTLSSHAMQSLLETCSETDQHFRVFEIYSIMSRHPHHFELNGKICWLLVHCCVVMKDFECAYKMVNELQKKYFKYKTTMYNAIMAGYFFEKNKIGGLEVLKQMRDANVKLDSYTFSYLIENCETKEEIKKYYEEMEQSGIHLTKEVFVALIHAYVPCGEYYEERDNKDVLWNLHGELERVLLLLKELSGQDWVDGCRWAIRYSVQNKNLSSTIELFKQLKDYYKNDAPERSDPLYFGSKKLVFNVDEVSFCFLMT
ncbi:PPR containing protein, putative [Medicago truncatula]|uniref:PPR containing protein, putative n=1 Tax=Medicago truncatula TaxID=3880 RepID=G7JLP0_MEDTR|nr:PPR containing protein, putative [Medicago truncatula]